MCLCVCVCLHSLRSYILFLHPIVLSVFVYNYLHTQKKSVQHFISRERDREGRKKEEEREKIISGASSLE